MLSRGCCLTLGCWSAIGFLICGCEKENKQIPFAPVVKVDRVKKEVIPLNVEAAGKISGSLDIEVRAQVGGILKERKFKEGQFVQKGASLFLIDPVPYKTTLSKMEGVLAQALSELRRTTRDLKRMEKMFKAKAVSQKEYDDSMSAFESAKANVKVAEANVREAKINLEYTNVRAPISGVVRKENQTVGNLISTAGTSSLLTSMVQTDPLRVQFAISGEFWRKVLGLIKTREVNMPNLDSLSVQIMRPNGEMLPVKGKITFVDNSEDEQTSTIVMKADIPNKNESSGLLPGQFVRVRVVGAKYQNPVVPNSSVIATPNGNMVYVIDDKNVAKIRPVRVKLLGNKAIVMDGLKEGEVVVTDGVIKVRADSKITPVFASETQKGNI